MSLTLVTLNDGSQVAQSALFTTCMNLESIAKENHVALFDLFHKCQNPNFKIVKNSLGLGDSKVILKERELMDEKENIHEDIKKIVLNSIKIDGLAITLINPLKPN